MSEFEELAGTWIEDSRDLVYPRTWEAGTLDNKYHARRPGGGAEAQKN
jgi:hypothetical protein